MGSKVVSPGRKSEPQAHRKRHINNSPFVPCDGSIALGSERAGVSPDPVRKRLGNGKIHSVNRFIAEC